jgi:ATP-dependent DNA ligase
MLARAGPLPSGPAWTFELKWDGFRAIVSTEDGLHVRSRRGWNMTPVLPELRKLPSGLVLDGELVAWTGRVPWFPNVCRRVPNNDMGGSSTLRERHVSLRKALARRPGSRLASSTRCSRTSVRRPRRSVLR